MELIYFMWPYQPHFQLYAQMEADRIFRQLDPRFSPRVFLVGFLKQPVEKRHPICVSPDDCEYQPDVFVGVLEAARAFLNNDPEKDILHSHPKAEEYHRQRMVIRAHWNALKQAVEAATESRRWVTFCSAHAEFEGYWISMVLQLQADVYETCYRLRKSTVRVPFESSVAQSFLDKLISEYLSASIECLMKPNPGEHWANVTSAAQLFQTAAKSIMYTPAAAGQNLNGLHGLYEACNTISTLKYESKEGIGKFVIARRGHPDVAVELSLSHPVSLSDYGAVRKLLQMGSGRLSLLCDSAEVYGLGIILGSYDPTQEDLFVIEFISHFVWKLTHAGQCLLYVRYGTPWLREPQFPQVTFLDVLMRRFPSMGGEKARKICQIARHLAAMSRGSLLIVSGNANAEVERLANQSTPVVPLKLDIGFLGFISSIDGAILVDTDGNCHAICVILDGIASAKCKSSRGARFNSAIRYVYGRTDAVAVVKSEDGMIDVLPDSRLCIRRSNMEEHLKQLREIAGQDVVEPNALYDVRKWLGEHRFYFSKEHCDEINTLIQQALGRFPETASKVTGSEFVPNEEMNDSYFAD